MPVVELGVGAVGQRHRDMGLDAVGHLRAASAAFRAVTDPVGVMRRHRIAGRKALLHRLVLGRLLGQVALEREPERGLRLGQRDAILRALRPGDAGNDVAQVELERVGERRFI